MTKTDKSESNKKRKYNSRWKMTIGYDLRNVWQP